jgi:hypothetical protein
MLVLALALGTSGTGGVSADSAVRARRGAEATVLRATATTGGGDAAAAQLRHTVHCCGLTGDAGELRIMMRSSSAVFDRRFEALACRRAGLYGCRWRSMESA